MEGKWLDLPREVLLTIPNTCGDIRVVSKKSADTIVITMPCDEGLNVKSCDLNSYLEMCMIISQNKTTI